MVINHNIAALNTTRQLSINSANSSKSLEKLSSGLRINKAGDDAAGLAISEKMRGQIRGLDQAGRNAQDGISMIQTAEGALNETHSILQRMRELAVQAATDTNTAADRGEMQKEIDQLSTEITRISTDTEFNTKKLLNGQMGKSLAATVTTATLQNLQVTGSNVGNGTYALTLAGAEADTVTLTNTSLNAGFLASDITVDTGAQIAFGSYRLEVSSYAGAGTSATLTLTGPDGTVSTMTGQNVGTADVVNLGGLNLDTGTAGHAITQNGVMNFTLTSNLQVTLTGTSAPGTGTGAIAAYAGETLNVGGFQFAVKTNHGGDTTANSGTVTDNAVKFQIGANANQNTNLAINNMSASALGVNTLNVTNQIGANTAITTIDTAITTVSSERSKIGAMQNRLEHTIANLGTTSENLTASESRIRDVDMAKEMMEFTKTNILSQAAQAMLAQANTQPQGVLQLLR